jgi:hypothetical protein
MPEAVGRARRRRPDACGAGRRGPRWARLLAVAATCVLVSPLARADGASSLTFELNAVGGYSDADGWISEVRGSQRNSVGFEYFRKLANEYGDFLTVDLQSRLSYDSSEPGGHPVGLEIHGAWAEYKLGLGRSLRVGHFAPAHGLEPVTDTHGTILQTLAMEDIGFKKDWGVSYRSLLGPFDLSLAAQLGSGMGIQRSDRSFLLSAQVWEPPGNNFRYGLSVLAGRVLPSRGGWTIPAPDFESEAVPKVRAGGAAVLESGSFEFRGELSVGKNEATDVMGAMLGAAYAPPSLQSLAVEAQGRAWSGDLDAGGALASSVSLGASYALTRGWTIRGYVIRELSRPGGSNDTSAVLQAYYFGG